MFLLPGEADGLMGNKESKACDVLVQILSEGRFSWDGESYFPGIDDYNEKYKTEYTESNAEWDLNPSQFPRLPKIVRHLMHIFECNVDGCGGCCDVYVQFFCSMSKEQILDFQNTLQQVKKENADSDFDTEDFVAEALSRFFVETGIEGGICNAPADSIIEF